MSDRFKTFLISYNHEGQRWSAEIKARDWADAEARLARLAFGRIDGELVATVPASLGPIVAITASIRNGFARVFARQSV